MSGGTFFLMNKKREKEGKMKELRESFRKADKDGDGALSQEEWMGVMKQNGIEMTKKEMTIMFTQRDRDHDGLLSFEEFAGQETKLEKAFKAIDKDGDGYLTKAEFRSVCRNLTSEQVELAFKKFDKAGNGKLNYIEFCGMMNARKLKKAGVTDRVVKESVDGVEPDEEDEDGEASSSSSSKDNSRPSSTSKP